MLYANHEVSEQVLGTVFDIKRYAVHDGPGIRTTVFLKGCPLRCLWCHNPESQDPRPDIMYHDNLCVECWECVKACPAKAQTLDREHKIRRDLCTRCGRCVEACYPGALKLMGRQMTFEAVLRELEKDEHFYRRSGGGVTLSGGEPASQPDFTMALLKECMEKSYHTVLQTYGHVGWPTLERILRYTDLVLYDVKHARAVVPGYSDSPGCVEALGDFLSSLERIRDVELLPYHQFGISKYRSLGRTYLLGEVKPPPQDELLQLGETLRKRGLNVLVESITHAQ